jgi:light-regulated signal transduction histidine kinase (bacteriophytochrome)
MSSVKPDPAAEESDALAALHKERREHEQFCVELADGLHALAQPLTIVRSAISLLDLARESSADSDRPTADSSRYSAESDRYIDMSGRQIDRACQIFASIQALLAAHIVPASCQPVEIEDLLLHIVADRSQRLDEKGIGLAASSAIGAVFADRNRIEQAIVAAITAAASVAAAGEVIQIDTSRCEEQIEFIIQCTGKLENSLSSSERLNLSVARASVLSQQGRYRFTQEPFRISFALPALQQQIEKHQN